MGESFAPRLNAILPLKVTVGSDPQSHFIHTLDISAFGARVIMPMALDPGSDVVLEYKKRLTKAIVVWAKPARKSTRDYELGLRLLNGGPRFWLLELSPKTRILTSEGRAI
jgi:hypothetical protein